MVMFSAIPLTCIGSFNNGSNPLKGTSISQFLIIIKKGNVAILSAEYGYNVSCKMALWRNW